MRAHQGLVVVISLAAVMTWPSAAAAQGSTSGLPIAVGQKVTVTTGDGRKTSGKVFSLTPTTLDVSEGGGIKSFAVADVTRVLENDSTKNGVIKGAFWMGLTGFLAGSFVDAGNAAGDALGGFFVVILGGEPPPIHHSRNYLTGAVAGVGIGALVGYALDAGNQKTLYERETAGMSVAVRPIVSAAGQGVGVRVRW